MKVKDLIKRLQEFDSELEVVVCDEIEGNDSELKDVEMGKTQIDERNTSSNQKDCLLIRW